jgi:hypothetical protein
LTHDHLGFTVAGESPCPLNPDLVVIGRGSSLSGGGVNLDVHLTVTEAAQLARVSKQLVNWWRTSGRLAGQRHNGVWMYRARDVLAVERDTRQSPLSHRAA